MKLFCCYPHVFMFSPPSLPPSLPPSQQPPEEESDDEDDQWAAANTYANYKPAKCESHTMSCTVQLLVEGMNKIHCSTHYTVVFIPHQ